MIFALDHTNICAIHQFHLFNLSLYASQWVGNIDLNANDQADANIIVDKDAGWTDQETSIINQLQGLLSSNQLDAVICVAGNNNLSLRESQM